MTAQQAQSGRSAQPAQRACPSSSAGHATHLLGVVDGGGRVRYVSPALPLTDEFRERVADAGDAERRFRFTGPCVESGCAQWGESGCGVVEDLLEQVGGADLGTELRPCTIRRECRWFAQRGADACHVCPLVVTDSRVLA